MTAMQPARSDRLDTAVGRPYDVIVVGAGINGTGIARDAALRGLRVLLLDKGDVGSGTTSWSSRLVHGGLRYLEHGEIGLVRESLRERERLLRIAPHLVRPLPLLIPIYRGARRGRWQIRAGMLAYDLLSFDKSLDRHHMLSAEQAIERAPSLGREGLKGAALYYDGQVEYAERLALENALSAREAGATVLTYARVTRLLRRGAAVGGVAFVDALAGGEEREAIGSITINVAGPWVDELLAGSEVPGPRQIGGTKGSHVVVAPFAGAPRDALYVEARRDGRPFFVIPWNDLYLIGTTDLRYDGDLDRVVATEEEIAYLLEETNSILPAAALTRHDVLYTYAGIRPLPFQPDGKEGAITRRHLIKAPEETPGLLSIVGGKLTTYRELAEQAVEIAGKRLGPSLPPSRTGTVPLPGADVKGEDLAAFTDRWFRSCDLPARSARHLLKVYGARATDVLAFAARTPALLEPIDAFSGAIGAEIVWAFQEELAETLTDALLRRTMIGLGPDVGLGAVHVAAAIARTHRGWDEERAAREIAAYHAYVERFTPRVEARRG
jgi:glycerol-3-phosphate dehydrogenase